MLGISILGPLEVLDDGNEVQLRGAKHRALLVILILNRGKAVSADHLIDLLWGSRPPATAAKALQVYISGLRKEGREGSWPFSCSTAACRKRMIGTIGSFSCAAFSSKSKAMS